jgi:hypothetical protein
MRNIKFFQSCLATVALIAVAGCSPVTKKLNTASSHVKTFNGTYKAPKSVSVQNDIKGILVAGGLNTGNPSAPTRSTKVAEIMNSTKPSQAVTQLVAKLEGSSNPNPLPNVEDSKRLEQRVEPTTLIASIQENQNSQSKSKASRVKREVSPAKSDDSVMLALNTVAPTPVTRPDNSMNVAFDVAPSKPTAQIPSMTITAQRDETTTRYPDIGIEVAYAEPIEAPKRKTTPKRSRPARAVSSPVVKAPEPVVQQASLQVAKPRRF